MTDIRTFSGVVNAHQLEVQALRVALANAAANAQYWHERWRTDTNTISQEIAEITAALKTALAENEKHASRATNKNMALSISRAIEVMMEWGHTSDLHKGWVLDQVARALAGYRDGEDDDTYQAFLAQYEKRTGEEWDKGIEP